MGQETERVRAGAERLAEAGFREFAGRRIGLITNHTGLVGGEHLADVMARTPGIRLDAILAPEHGFRGRAEAGAKVGDEVDARTGVKVMSLYGRTRKPTRDMLQGLDALVFDIQDVGVRFYTYISTMGLAMQAAAEARLPFVVLDRPNPLGGDDVSGFVLEPAQRSFVGQYEIPIVHGMTVGELARMIKGERLLAGLDTLELSVIEMAGWRRAMRWPATGMGWVATSPNIPTFEAALVYPGIGIVGELLVNEGRGTPTPFSQFGAPWLDAGALVRQLEDQRLPGVRFRPVRYTPRSIPYVATMPRFRDVEVAGVRIEIVDPVRYRPLETGIHALTMLAGEARRRGLGSLIPDAKLFDRIAGTARLRVMIEEGRAGGAIIAAWQEEAARFNDRRAPYLLYR